MNSIVGLLKKSYGDIKSSNKPGLIQACCNLCIITNISNFAAIIFFVPTFAFFVKYLCMAFKKFVNLDENNFHFFHIIKGEKFSSLRFTIILKVLLL